MALTGTPVHRYFVIILWTLHNIMHVIKNVTSSVSLPFMEKGKFCTEDCHILCLTDCYLCLSKWHSLLIERNYIHVKKVVSRQPRLYVVCVFGCQSIVRYVYI